MGEQPLAAATEPLGRPIEVYEERLQSHLRALRKVLAELLDWRMSEEKQGMDYLARSEAERGRIRAEFERLRRLLAEKERAALARLAELDAAFEATQEEKRSRVAEGIVRLHGLIGQLEAKRLPQDIGSILGSWSEMKLQLPSGLPMELEKSLSSCRHQRDALLEALKEIRDMGRPEPNPGPGNFPSREKKAKATVDPSWVPLPQLLADRKSVRWDEEEQEAGGEPQQLYT